MFTTNVPAIAENFFDRKDELARLEGVVDALTNGNPCWLAILGLRKVGKTSLLLELERSTRRKRLVFVIVDTYEVHPLSTAIFRLYALRFLDAVFSTELGVSLETLSRRPAEYRMALQHSKRFGRLPPQLKGQILELPETPTDGDFVRDVLTLPESVAESLGLTVLVAWDEFQRLATMTAGRKGEDYLPLMRAVWQRHTRVGYVISGSERTMLKNLLLNEHSPFFQHFSLMELGPLPKSEAVELLVESAPQGREIPQSIALRAVDALGGHPFYVQLLGETLTMQDPPYDERSFKSALQELLFSRMGRLSLFFEKEFNKLVGRSTYLAAVLDAVCDDSPSLSEIARKIGTTAGATVRYLERLGDAITRDVNNRYSITDPTFGIWLRWRKPGGTVLPMTFVGDDAERVVADHLARMGFDLVYQSRASRGAFDLLALRGHIQLGIQVKRSPLPIRFKKSEWNRMSADAKRFGWRWVIAAFIPGPPTSVVILDPARVRLKREARLDEEATITNLLEWLA